MKKAKLEEKLKKGIDELRLSIPENIQRMFLDFLVLLRKWNQTYNLTAIDDIDNMISYHILDSLSIIPYFKGKIILDVGSGAGFPGIPLALICPDKQFILLDSNRKKFAFLLQAISQFKISNVVIVQARVSDYQREFNFDAITCRAFGSLGFIIDKTQHLLCPLGRWFVMKGIYPKEELRIIVQSFIVHRLIVPGLNAERHLVEIKNKCSLQQHTDLKD